MAKSKNNPLVVDGIDFSIPKPTTRPLKPITEENYEIIRIPAGDFVSVYVHEKDTGDYVAHITEVAKIPEDEELEKELQERVRKSIEQENSQ